MEAFKKWKQENYHPESNLVDSDDYKEGYSDGLESGWRAVLEWVLTMKKEEGCINDPMNMYYHIPDWAVGKIEEELEE